MPSTFRSMRAYEIRPEGVRARDEESADSMKHHSLTEVERGKRGRAHRRSRIPRFRILSNAQKSVKRLFGTEASAPAGSPDAHDARIRMAEPTRRLEDGRSRFRRSGECSRTAPVSTEAS